MSGMTSADESNFLLKKLMSDHIFKKKTSFLVEIFKKDDVACILQ